MTPEEYYQRYLEGDDEAIGGVIDGFYGGLMRFVEGITGDYHDAEDVVQEVFIRISLKKSIYRGKGRFKAWVYAIARNCALSAAAGRRTMLERLEFDEEKLMMIAGPDTSDPGELLEADEETERFIANLRALKPKHRQILYLMYVKDFTPGEIARVMHMRPREVYRCLAAARESYRRLIEGETGNEQD